MLTFEKADGSERTWDIWDVGPIRRDRRAKPMSNSFAQAARAQGDLRFEPATLEVSVVIAGVDGDDWLANHRELISWADQAVKIKYRNWYYLIGSLAQHTEKPHSRARKVNLTREALEFNLTLPYRVAEDPVTKSGALAAGANDVQLTNQGDAEAWPVVVIEGSAVTSVQITIGARTLDWTGSALSTDSLAIDCLNGLATIAARDILEEIADDSVFPNVATGTQDMTVTLTGGSGTYSVEFEELYL